MRIARDRKGQGFSKAAIMPTLQEEIEAGNAKFMAAFDKGDMSALSLLYTEDCKVMPTGAGVLREEELFQTYFNMSVMLVLQK